MTLPALPRAGKSLALPACVGSSDALVLASVLEAARADGRCVLIVTAAAADAQRLADELPFFAPLRRCALFPDWETLPYDAFSPHDDLVSERMATLYALQRDELDAMLVAAPTALTRLPPPSFLAAHTFFFRKGQRIDERSLREQLTRAGYDHVTQVVSPGEYSVRGGLIDLFPMGATLPFRLDLFGDELESIRTFDPDNQRSLYPVDEIRLLPGHEFPMDEEARLAFRSRWREHFEGDPSRAPIYRDIGNGIAPAGIEYYLPLFFESTASLFDYLPGDALVVLLGDVEAEGRRFWVDAENRYRFLAHDVERPLLGPDKLFERTEQFFAATRQHGRLTLRRVEATGRGDSDSDRDTSAGADAATGAGTRTDVDVDVDVDVGAEADADVGQSKHGADATANGVPATSAVSAVSATKGTKALQAMAGMSPATMPLEPLAVDRRADDPIAALRRFVAVPGRRTLIVGESAGRRETLVEYFEQHRLHTRPAESWREFVDGDAALMLAVAPLHEGFMLPQAGIAVVTEAELFAAVVRRGSRRGREAQTNIDSIIRDLSELKVGDPVVHAQHGIGRYQGLIGMDLGEGETEFLHLVYADAATLYVPVAQLHQISRYSGAAPEDAPLHQLGSGQWEKARRKAAQQARDTAAELLDLYARRATRAGHAFKFTARDYEAFVEDFGFEETADQLAAIHATIQDMVAGRPMDRLVCGDVGFGKTEVALRAAFVAVADGRQVAVLTPTTLLAEQHYQTFSDRFASWPVRIAELSRFRSARETRSALDGLAKGEIDIVIGTHKLLSGDVRFARLGLVIIDEEHRFGVRQKEALKALRAEVDVLTLTATPIPRTLAMSLEGLRDFSVIATAPQRRLAIKTFVRRESDGTIREALLRELKRGGQAYFLHNEVESIERRRESLRALVPEARIAVAHGQMPERELERVMREFHQQRSNVLLCTTIIETGIDVPTANTIVIHRADRFGLAQLHQLRGRVGRSHHQAYAYLLIPDEQSITRDAGKRLEAIQMMEQLGSGFYLAMHDLEIRGAGQVLGESQSGQVQEVGFQLYTDMIEAAVRALKAGREPDLAAPLAITTEINLHVPALLPDDYCPDVHERLTLYKRLANCASLDALTAMREELVDRFGKLPEQARALIETHRLRIDGRALGIVRIDAAPQAIVLQFGPNPPIDPAHIIAFVQSRRDVRLSGPDRLRFTVTSADLEARVGAVRGILRGLVA